MIDLVHAPKIMLSMGEPYELDLQCAPQLHGHDSGPLYVANKNPAGGWAMAHPMIGQPPGLVAVPTCVYSAPILCTFCQTHSGLSTCMEM